MREKRRKREGIRGKEGEWMFKRRKGGRGRGGEGRGELCCVP